MSEQQDYLPMQEVPAEKPDENIELGREKIGRFYCALHETPTRVFEPGVIPVRQQLILRSSNKWANGTALRYYFFDRDTDGENVLLSNGTTVWRSWVGSEAEKAVVRRGFQVWKDVGIGLSFQEVNEREEAEIRIGFMKNDGAWSWLGREILKFGPNERTMNFGWDITPSGELDTAVHEIGHTLGFPHEHQNPNAGIEWDEEAVYASLAAHPNRWDRQTTYWNIIRKLSLNEVKGSQWDPNSVMHYPLDAGFIKKPVDYVDGLQPAGGLSERDKAWVQIFYPPLTEVDEEELKPSQSALLNISAGEQRNFTITPQETRYYEFRTIGVSDSVMVLFEDDRGELRYRTADDDSGKDSNAYFRIRLLKGRRYVLRIRLYYSERPKETAVIMW